MRELSASRLGALVLQTLEEAAFVFAEPAGDAPPFEGEVLEARLGWAGPGGGELRLATTPGLAAQLAANLLGVEEAPGRGADALGELLNMAAGAVVAELYGPRDARRLLLPEVVRLPAAGRAAGPAPAVAAALVDDEGRRIEIALYAAAEGAA